MLLYFEKLKDLDFRQLMDIYEESNLENGNEMYHFVSDNLKLLYAEQSFYQYLSECFFPTAGAKYAVWLEEERYVSALRLEPYQDGLLIEGLETRPDMRNRGFAKKLLFSVRASTGETPLYSHVAKKNLASVRTHLSCGFDHLLEYAIYADGSVLQNCCTFCYRHRSERKDLR